MSAETSGDFGLQELKKCPPTKIYQFIHEVVNSACQLGAPCYQDFSKIWDTQQWGLLIEAWQNFLCSVVSQGTTKDEMNKQLNWLPSDYQEIIHECITVRREDLHQALLKKSCTLSQSYLTDFDWNLRLVLASDKLSSIQEPLLSLDLDLHTDLGKKFISIEMTKDDLKKTLATLEGAQKAINLLKT